MAKANEPFRVPSLAEVDSDYAALLQKQAELTARQAELEREKRAVEKAIAADTSREVKPEIAALLGDEPGSKALNRRRVAEIRSEIADIEQAVIVLRQRLADARGRASTAVVAASRMEYARRVKAMVEAVEALSVARAEYDKIVDDFVANDVAWTSLTPLQPTFCGDRQDGHLQRWLRAAREAGYGD
jgi:chromosome segregation ATPase